MAPARVSLTQLLGPAAVTMAIAAALMVLYVVKHDGYVSTLLCVGANRAGQPPFEDIAMPVGPNGYDGQFYYAIAQAPWRLHNDEQIDNPAARQLRIFYPALCWLLSSGDPRTLLWVMPLVNLLAVGGLAATGAWLAAKHGRSPWWGITLPAATNTYLSTLHDLTDPIATLAIVGLLVAWLAYSPEWIVALCATAAIFSREQNLAVISILGMDGVLSRRTSATTALATSVLLWVLWVWMLRVSYDTWPFLGGSGNFDSPLAGMWFRWIHPGGNDGFSRRLSIFIIASMLHLSLQIGIAVYLAVRHSPNVVTTCMLAGVALALVGGTSIYGDFWSYTRVFVWIPMGIWQFGISGRSRWEMLTLAPAGWLWPVAGALRYV